MRPVRVPGYICVSTAQRASSLGRDAKRSAIEAACWRRRWKLVDVLVDFGGSATVQQRPALEEALSRPEGNVPAAEAVVVTKLDRLGRSLEHLIELSKELQSRGVDLVLDQGIDTSTPVGRLFFSIIGAIAEFEHALMSERTMDGLAATRARGRTGGGRGWGEVDRRCGGVLAGGPVAVLLTGRFLALGRIAPDWALEALDAAGAGAYALLGLGGLILAGTYLKNFLPLGIPSHLLSGGFMPLNSIAVGLEVTGGFLVLWTQFLDQALLVRRGA